MSTLAKWQGPNCWSMFDITNKYAMKELHESEGKYNINHKLEGIIRTTNWAFFLPMVTWISHRCSSCHYNTILPGLQSEPMRDLHDFLFTLLYLFYFMLLLFPFWLPRLHYWWYGHWLFFFICIDRIEVLTAFLTFALYGSMHLYMDPCRRYIHWKALQLGCLVITPGNGSNGEWEQYGFSHQFDYSFESAWPVRSEICIRYIHSLTVSIRAYRFPEYFLGRHWRSSTFSKP